MSASTQSHRTNKATHANPSAPHQSAPRVLGTLLASAATLAAGCAIPIQPARMALPASLESAATEPFEGLKGGRSGRFTLDGEAVTFRRTGDRLSVFERLQFDHVAVEFERADVQGRCAGSATGLTAGIVDTPLKPLALSCRFGGALAGELSLREPRLAAGGTRQAREGEARFGTLVIEIRSEHALAGSPLPLAQPAGYRLIVKGRDVAALDLAGGTPVLRRAAGLDDNTRAALVQVALALGLLFDPAVTLG
jgi:hypothetical protein